MSRENTNKLNLLLSSWGNNHVRNTKWLKAKGYYQQLVDRYEKSGWIAKVGQGAYKKAGDEVNWASGLNAVQRQLEKEIYVAGKSALELHGNMQYLSLGKKPVMRLYGQKGTVLPRWFKDYDWDVTIDFHISSLFDRRDNSLTSREVNGIEIKLSNRERGIMEFMEKVQDEHSFQEMVDIYEGLTTLRSSVVQELLEKCNSIKVKRLFLYITELLNPRIFKKLDLAKINRGKGKRSIVKNGHLDKKYLI